nr:MAG TPA: chitin synthase regulator [Caudoviricetes sp.]
MTEWEVLLLVYTGAFGLLMLVYGAWGRNRRRRK